MLAIGLETAVPPVSLSCLGRGSPPAEGWRAAPHDLRQVRRTTGPFPSPEPGYVGDNGCVSIWESWIHAHTNVCAFSWLSSFHQRSLVLEETKKGKNYLAEAWWRYPKLYGYIIFCKDVLYSAFLVFGSVFLRVSLCLFLMICMENRWRIHPLSLRIGIVVFIFYH